MALAANALTLLDTAKSHLDIPLTNTSQDPTIERLINVASNLIARKCRRILKDTTHSHYFDGRASNRILLREYPVQSITSLKISNDSDFTSVNPEDASTYRIVDRDTTLLYLSGRIFPKGYSNIEIVYTAGEGLVSGSTNTYPADLEQAALDYVLWLYDVNNDRRLGRTSKSKGGESVEFEQTIPKSIMDQIEPYVRFEFPEAEVGVRNN